jgi:GT2 family glycosyltransferase
MANNYPGLRIIVVDNGSTDNSVEVLRREFPAIELVALATNQGYSTGNNAGIRHALDAGATHVLLVNNDAVLAPEAIGDLVDGAERASALVAVPRIDRLGTSSLWSAGARRGGVLPLPRDLGERDLLSGEPTTIDFAVGCVLLIHRDVFEVIGLFDPRYFAYYEDLEFSARVHAAGFRMVCVPMAHAWHAVGLSTRSAPPHRTYLQMRSRTLWCRVQRTGLAAIAWWLTLVSRLIGTVAFSLRTGQRGYVSAAWRGLLDGMRIPVTGAAPRLGVEQSAITAPPNDSRRAQPPDAAH